MHNFWKGVRLLKGRENQNDKGKVQVLWIILIEIFVLPIKPSIIEFLCRALVWEVWLRSVKLNCFVSNNHWIIIFNSLACDDNLYNISCAFCLSPWSFSSSLICTWTPKNLPQTLESPLFLFNHGPVYCTQSKGSYMCDMQYVALFTCC